MAGATTFVASILATAAFDDPEPIMVGYHFGRFLWPADIKKGESVSCRPRLRYQNSSISPLNDGCAFS